MSGEEETIERLSLPMGGPFDAFLDDTFLFNVVLGLLLVVLTTLFLWDGGGKSSSGSGSKSGISSSSSSLRNSSSSSGSSTSSIHRSIKLSTILDTINQKQYTRQHAFIEALCVDVRFPSCSLSSGARAYLQLINKDVMLRIACALKHMQQKAMKKRQNSTASSSSSSSSSSSTFAVNWQQIEEVVLDHLFVDACAKYGGVLKENMQKVEICKFDDTRICISTLARTCTHTHTHTQHNTHTGNTLYIVHWLLTITNGLWKDDTANR